MQQVFGQKLRWQNSYDKVFRLAIVSIKHAKYNMPAGAGLCSLQGYVHSRFSIFRSKSVSGSCVTQPALRLDQGSEMLIQRQFGKCWSCMLQDLLTLTLTNWCIICGELI